MYSDDELKEYYFGNPYLTPQNLLRFEGLEPPLVMELFEYDWEEFTEMPDSSSYKYDFAKKWLTVYEYVGYKELAEQWETEVVRLAEIHKA